MKAALQSLFIHLLIICQEHCQAAIGERMLQQAFDGGERTGRHIGSGFHTLHDVLRRADGGFGIVAAIFTIYIQISKFLFIFASSKEWLYEAGNKFTHITIVYAMLECTIRSDLDQDARRQDGGSAETGGFRLEPA